jgi:hypothetical protein
MRVGQGLKTLPYMCSVGRGLQTPATQELPTLLILKRRPCSGQRVEVGEQVLMQRLEPLGDLAGALIDGSKTLILLRQMSIHALEALEHLGPQLLQPQHTAREL